MPDTDQHFTESVILRVRIIYLLCTLYLCIYRKQTLLQVTCLLHLETDEGDSLAKVRLHSLHSVRLLTSCPCKLGNVTRLSSSSALKCPSEGGPSFRALDACSAPASAPAPNPSCWFGLKCLLDWKEKSNLTHGSVFLVIRTWWREPPWRYMIGCDSALRKGGEGGGSTRRGSSQETLPCPVKFSFILDESLP